jgi:hypothetical protein
MPDIIGVVGKGLMHLLLTGKRCFIAKTFSLEAMVEIGIIYTDLVVIGGQNGGNGTQAKGKSAVADLHEPGKWGADQQDAFSV